MQSWQKLKWNQGKEKPFLHCSALRLWVKVEVTNYGSVENRQPQNWIGSLFERMMEYLRPISCQQSRFSISYQNSIHILFLPVHQLQRVLKFHAEVMRYVMRLDKRRHGKVLHQKLSEILSLSRNSPFHLTRRTYYRLISLSCPIAKRGTNYLY